MHIAHRQEDEVDLKKNEKKPRSKDAINLFVDLQQQIRSIRRLFAFSMLQVLEAACWRAY